MSPRCASLSLRNCRRNVHKAEKIGETGQKWTFVNRNETNSIGVVFCAEFENELYFFAKLFSCSELMKKCRKNPEIMVKIIVSGKTTQFSNSAQKTTPIQFALPLYDFIIICKGSFLTCFTNFWCFTKLPCTVSQQQRNAARCSSVRESVSLGAKFRLDQPSS